MKDDEQFECKGFDISDVNLRASWWEALPDDFGNKNCEVEEEYKDGYCVWHYNWGDEPEDHNEAINHLCESLTTNIDRIDGAHLNGLKISTDTLDQKDSEEGGLSDFFSVYLPFSNMIDMEFQGYSDGDESDNNSYDSNFPVSNLNNTNFKNIDLSLSDFRFSDMTGSTFYDCEITNASFEGCRVSDNLIEFDDCKIEACSFEFIGLLPKSDNGADILFKNTDIPESNFEHADLRYLVFEQTGNQLEIDAERSIFRNTKIQNLVLHNISEIKFRMSDWERSNVKSIKLFSNSETNVNFKKANLVRSDFSEITLPQCNFEAADLTATNFQASTLYSPLLYDTNIEDVRINRSTEIQPPEDEADSVEKSPKTSLQGIWSVLYVVIYAGPFYLLYLLLIGSSQNIREGINRISLFSTSAPNAVKTGYETNTGNNDEKSFDERLHQAIAQNQGLKKAHTRWGLEEATDYAYQYWKLREKLQRTRARAILKNIANTNGSAKEASSIESINYDSSQHTLFKTILRSVRLSFHGVLSDYGENPFKVIKISIGIMIFFAWIYLLGGDGFYMNSSVIGSETLISQLVSTNTNWTHIKNPCFIEFSPLGGGCIGGIEGGMTHLLYAFYFSTITFTTLGYAGTAPAGLSRYIAMAQSFMGGLMIAYIIFVVGHRIGERATR